jgi:basic membrane protein A
MLDGQEIEQAVEGHVHGKDLSAGFAQDWVQLLELNTFAAAEGTEAKLSRVVEAFCRGQIDVFRGNYTGVNPNDPSDTIDLSQGYTENRDSSNPSFAYILQDYITIEE